MFKSKSNSDLNSKSKACCHKEIYIVNSSQLPLCCPLRNERVWDAHPRVYLPIEKKGRVTCPYCGTKYILEGASVDAFPPGGVVPPGKTWLSVDFFDQFAETDPDLLQVKKDESSRDV